MPHTPLQPLLTTPTAPTAAAAASTARAVLSATVAGGGRRPASRAVLIDTRQTPAYRALADQSNVTSPRGRIRAEKKLVAQGQSRGKGPSVFFPPLSFRPANHTRRKSLPICCVRIRAWLAVTGRWRRRLGRPATRSSQPTRPAGQPAARSPGRRDGKRRTRGVPQPLPRKDCPPAHHGVPPAIEEREGWGRKYPIR